MLGIKKRTWAPNSPEVKNMKTKLRKRDKIFNKISNVIDYLQTSWINVIKVIAIFSFVLFACYMVLIWMPTVERIIFEIRYL